MTETRTMTEAWRRQTANMYIGTPDACLACARDVLILGLFWIGAFGLADRHQDRQWSTPDHDGSPNMVEART